MVSSRRFVGSLWTPRGARTRPATSRPTPPSVLPGWTCHVDPAHTSCSCGWRCSSGPTVSVWARVDLRIGLIRRSPKINCESEGEGFRITQDPVPGSRRVRVRRSLGSFFSCGGTTWPRGRGATVCGVALAHHWHAREATNRCHTGSQIRTVFDKEELGVACGSSRDEARMIQRCRPWHCYRFEKGIRLDSMGANVMCKCQSLETGIARMVVHTTYVTSLFFGFKCDHT